MALRLQNRNRNRASNPRDAPQRLRFQNRNRTSNPRDAPQSSRPWYVIFIFVLPLQLNLLQLHFHDSSPFETHPINMWTFLFALLFYCIALGYCVKSWLRGTRSFRNICDQVGYVSGSLASAALISVLVPPSFEPFVFVTWIVVSTMFVHVTCNWIFKVAQNLKHFAKDAVSCNHNIRKGIIGNNYNIGATTEEGVIGNNDNIGVATELV